MADQAPQGRDYDSSTDDDSSVSTVATDQPVLTVRMAEGFEHLHSVL